MRVIASALKCRKNIHSELICLWNENTELNAPFSELFESIEGLTIKSNPGIYNRVKSTYQKNPLKKLTVKVLNKSAGIDYCIKLKEMDAFIHSPKTEMADICAKFRNIYAQICEGMTDVDQEFQKFIPLKK